MEHLNDLDIQLLSDFESGILSKEQSEKIKKRLESDVEFKKLHVDLKLINSLLQEHYVIEKKASPSPVSSYLRQLEESLPEVHAAEETGVHLQKEKSQQREKGKTISIFRKNSLILAAACIALLIATGFFLTYKNVDMNSNKISASLLEPYPNTQYSQKMGTDTVSSEVIDAYRAYERKDYLKAITLFDMILKKQDDPYILFYAGSACYAMHEHDKAIEKFDRLLKTHKNFKLTDQALWYSALSSIEKAKSSLTKLEDEYYRRPGNILLTKYKTDSLLIITKN